MRRALESPNDPGSLLAAGQAHLSEFTLTMRKNRPSASCRIPETWDEFVSFHGPELRSNSQFELSFVATVLRNVRNIKPKDVAIQYKFVDCRGKSRYIDFVITVGVNPKIAIEVDGYDKRGFGEMNRDDFNDFTFRQNEISTRLGLHVLRFANGEFLNRPSDAIRQIEELVEKVWIELRPGVFARGIGKLAGGIGGALSSSVENAAIAFRSEREIQKLRLDQEFQKDIARAERRIAILKGEIVEKSVQEQIQDLINNARK